MTTSSSTAPSVQTIKRERIKELRNEICWTIREASPRAGRSAHSETTENRLRRLRRELATLDPASVPSTGQQGPYETRSSRRRASGTPRALKRKTRAP